MSVKSSKTELDAAIAAIEKSLAEVHFESRILLHKAVRSINGQNHQLLRGNEELKQGNEDLKRQIEELKLRNDELKKEVQVLCQKASNKQIQEDWESLQRFKTLLDVPDEDPSPEVDLDYCQKTLEKAFRKGSPNVRSSSSFSRMTLNALEEDEVYNRWMSNSHSSLFVISGRTKPESHDGHNTCSWLSMASIDVAEKLRADGSFTLFYSCHPKLRADDIIPFQAPLSMLIYQALTHRPELLRYENQHLQSLIRQWQKESHDREKLTLMIKTLRECLASATVNPQKPMYIILDRMDLCDGTKALKRHFLRQLLSLVTDDSLNLKLMLVLDSTLWEGLDDLFDDLLDDLRYDAKDRLLGKLGWHQTEQTPRLSSPEWV
ncbi:uncharacterized protein N7483_005058 [Penicillium malachiteum]|uniref:uncharacterized protein n=1 Tax=Penicillium malachiteum TaxID=1324776 RepID=UPI002548BCCB|nr:uncharacterized protein N7483_005058 [Penicillium malachiteum]KAJ5730550.1 hypothetical protein N7483_005058 [Penicillium malachiteum]